MIKLTDNRIKKMNWDADKRTRSGNVPQMQMHTDAVVQGLQLRLFPPKNGVSRKVFYYQYGTPEKRQTSKIGNWGEYSVALARKKAQEMRKQFYDEGINPARAKRIDKAERESEPTIAELIERHIADQKKRTGANQLTPKYLVAKESLLKRMLPDYGTWLANEFTYEQTRVVFSEIKVNAKEQARLFTTHVRVLFDWAKEEKLYPDSQRNPAVMTRLRSGEFVPSPRKVRTRVIRHDKGEGAIFFDVLKGFDAENTAMLKLYLLTGFRDAELRTAMWEDVDHEKRTLFNRTPKKINGIIYPYEQHLCDTAWEILESLQDDCAIAFRKGPIFPPKGRNEEQSTNERATRENWDVWKKKIKPLLKNRLPPHPEGIIEIHDLRRTGVTWLQALRVAEEFRTIWKGSTSGSITASNYSHADLLDIRKQCCKHVEKLLLQTAAGNEKKMFNVVPKMSITGTAY